MNRKQTDEYIQFPVPIRCVICRVKALKWVEFKSKQEYKDHVAKKHSRDIETHWYRPWE